MAFVDQPDFDGADISMYLLTTLGGELITLATAREIAKLVLRDRYGQEELDRQSPLNVEADGDNWIVKGSHKPEFNDGQEPGVSRQGHLVMSISKGDGRILKFAFAGGARWEKSRRQD